MEEFGYPDITSLLYCYTRLNQGDQVAVWDDDIGSTAEVIEAVFYNDNGDPVWVQALSAQVATENDTSFCFYYINGGYAPNLSGSLASNWYASSGCDYNTTASSSNRNSRRYFTDYETGRYWINLQLPSVTLPPSIPAVNYPASGSLSIGTSSNPAVLTKQANFHRIYTNNREPRHPHP